jgi:uncharacterized membrane protein YhdT
MPPTWLDGTGIIEFLVFMLFLWLMYKFVPEDYDGSEEETDDHPASGADAA